MERKEQGSYHWFASFADNRMEFLDLGFAVKNIYDNCSIWEERKQKPHDSGVGTEATSSAVSSDFDVTGKCGWALWQGIEYWRTITFALDVGDQTAHGVEPLEETSSHDEAAIQRDPSNLQRGIPLHRRQSILVEVPSQDHDKESPSNELRGRRLLVKSPCHCILQWWIPPIYFLYPHPPTALCYIDCPFIPSFHLNTVDTSSFFIRTNTTILNLWFNKMERLQVKFKAWRQC